MMRSLQKVFRMRRRVLPALCFGIVASLGGCVAYPYGYGYNGYYTGYYGAPAYSYPSGSYVALGFGDGGWNGRHWHHWHDHDGYWWR